MIEYRKIPNFIEDAHLRNKKLELIYNKLNSVLMRDSLVEKMSDFGLYPWQWEKPFRDDPVKEKG